MTGIGTSSSWSSSSDGDSVYASLDGGEGVGACSSSSSDGRVARAAHCCPFAGTTSYRDSTLANHIRPLTMGDEVADATTLFDFFNDRLDAGTIKSTLAAAQLLRRNGTGGFAAFMAALFGCKSPVIDPDNPRRLRGMSGIWNDDGSFNADQFARVVDILNDGEEKDRYTMVDFQRLIAANHERGQEQGLSEEELADAEEAMTKEYELLLALGGDGEDEDRHITTDRFHLFFHNPEGFYDEITS